MPVLPNKIITSPFSKQKSIRVEFENLLSECVSSNVDNNCFRIKLPVIKNQFFIIKKKYWNN